MTKWGSSTLPTPFLPRLFPVTRKPWGSMASSLKRTLESAWEHRRPHLLLHTSPHRIPLRKPWGSMASSLNQALVAVSEHRPQLLADVPPARNQEGSALLDAMLK